MGNKLYVFGHQKPDTDTITSAIVLANLERALGIDATAYKLGNINKETAYALKTFEVEEPATLESIEENLTDVAGIRIICSFMDDIYKVARMLQQQDDITVITVKDYIAKPKPNGYRSYHMIVEVPVFFSNEKRPMKVEVQIRTIAMDFWANLEHRMRYKKDIEAADEIMDELKECAENIAATDTKMMIIREKIRSGSLD